MHSKEIIALHEASRKCIWMRSIGKFIRTNCRLLHNNFSIVLYKDNSACVAQLQVGFVKGDRNKHIDPKYFSYTYDLITNQVLEIKKIILTNNLANHFTKALPLCIYCQLIHDIGMRQLDI